MAGALVAGFGRVEVQHAGVGQDMTGVWSGVAQIFVNWTVQRPLDVHITIAPDGRVSGTVGDAALRNGRFESNRGGLARALRWKTDWIVIADLDGTVINAEGIHRASVKIPMNWVDDHFEGGLNTSGTHVGRQETMWIAAGPLRLERTRAVER
jgi:hypothetical protein